MLLLTANAINIHLDITYIIMPSIIALCISKCIEDNRYLYLMGKDFKEKKNFKGGIMKIVAVLFTKYKPKLHT